jgi:hypothetical protein
MDNPETLATLCTQETRWRQTKQKTQHSKLHKSEKDEQQWTRPKI